MAIVKNNLFEDGDIPTAAQLNQPYDDAATITQNLDTDNTDDNWITINHLASQTGINQLFDFNYTGNVQEEITSASYVTIQNDGAGAYSIATLGYVAEVNEILRVESCGLQSASIATQTYDSTSATRGDRNYYAFRLSLFYNDGGGTSQLTLGEWGYTFTSMAGGNTREWTTNNGIAKETGVPLAYQTFQFSCVHINKVIGRTFEKIELQAKVNYTGNTLKITRNNIIAVRGQR